MSTPELNIRDLHAHAILERYHLGLGIPDSPGPAFPEPEGIPPLPIGTIGIIGAGAAGLYTAMILKSLDIEYEILEANSMVGGRLFTYKFSEELNDYYDAGAMRFPKIPLMDRTFDLFKRLNTPLIKYYLSTKNDIKLFNGYRVTGSSAATEDPFHVSVSKGGNVPDDYVKTGYDALTKAKLKPFRDALVKDFNTGWSYMMQYDDYSARGYFSLVDPKYPQPVVDWCETMNTATGWYDEAFTETVIESLDFDYPTKPPASVCWYAVQGGTQGVAEAMAKTLDVQPIFKKRVTSLRPVMIPLPSRWGDVTFRMLAYTGDSDSPRHYSHVVSTIPLSCLRLVDMGHCNLSYALKTALRILHYGASVKVAIKFKSRWWEPDHKGGLSTTDRPTRVVVYPSYGIGGKAATMICSYTWLQDAQRLGSLVQTKGSSADELLLDLVLRDLAAMHQKTYSDLKDLVLDHHAWDWYGSEFSCGAFALFGPGQFSTLYQELTKPAAWGMLHFAGEAASTSHAWVVGALNSAYRCVMEILVHEKRPDLIEKLENEWGKVGEVRQDLLEKQVLLGQHLPGEPEEM